MNSYRVVREMRRCVFAVCMFAALSLPVHGQISLGGLSGVARDSTSGKPLADALVVLRSSDPAARAAGTPQPTGRTDQNGRFQLHTYIGEHFQELGCE